MPATMPERHATFDAIHGWEEPTAFLQLGVVPTADLPRTVGADQPDRPQTLAVDGQTAFSASHCWRCGFVAAVVFRVGTTLFAGVGTTRVLLARILVCICSPLVVMIGVFGL